MVVCFTMPSISAVTAISGYDVCDPKVMVHAGRPDSEWQNNTSSSGNIHRKSCSPKTCHGIGTPGAVAGSNFSVLYLNKELSHNQIAF